MSLAVEHTLPHREVQVDRSESGSHAAESFIIDAAPTTASGRTDQDQEALRFATATPVTKPNRSSYDMQRQYQDAMDAHDLSMSPSDQHIVKEQAPVLPPRSALRASRLLTGLKISPSAEPLAYTQTHHEEYLSSEEDASSTSGDFSDFEYDSSSDDVPSPTEECSKHVTARVVSVIYSGKPSVIDVPHVRRSISPNSIERPASMGGLSDKASYMSELKSRRTSASTMSTRSMRSIHPQRPLPPRSSSMQHPHSDATKANLGFLRIDPYANGSSYSLARSVAEPLDLPEVRPADDADRPKTPKSPAVNMFKGVARAMSLMKRRSSPRLSQAYLSPDVEPLSQPASPLSIHEELPEDSSKEEVAQQAQQPESETMTVPAMPSRPPPQPFLRPAVTHNEILRIAKRNEQNKHLISSRSFQGDVLESPISPISPLSSKDNTATIGKRMSSFGFARRRMSVKIPGGKFQL